MTNIRVAALCFVFAASLFTAAPAHAQQTWEPYDGVTRLVSWFAKLNDQFEKLVATEKRGQLLRTTDRLRKELYALETDTRIALDNIPNTVPTSEQREYLSDLSADLLLTVQRLSIVVREFGADLRLSDANDVETALTHGLRTRAVTLTYLRNAIENSKAGEWNPLEVRKRLDQGLAAIKEAQVSVTSFRQKLSNVK